MKKVSIILACYNDGLSIVESTLRIINILDAVRCSYELIFIDDASTDNSKEEIAKLKELFPKITIRTFFHNKNVGRGGTVKEGIIKAFGEIVGFLDIDLEVSENYLPAFILSVEKGADMAIGKRVYKIQIDAILRFLGSVCYPILVKKILGLPFKDTEAGYKFFNREKILNVVKKTKDAKWFFDTEIVARAYFDNLKIEEIPVLFQRRSDKKSTVNFFRDSCLHLVKLLRFKNEMGIK